MKSQQPQFLVKHVGNMGDMVFLVPPALEVLKREHPGCHITLVTAWGYKHNRRGLPFFQKRAYWGARNQGGFCISLMMTNPHVDQLVHYHSSTTSLDATICNEDGRSFPTWSEQYYLNQKESGNYDAVYELDFGIAPDEDPIAHMYQVLGLPQETYSNYKLYFTESDKEIAAAAMDKKPHPRIVLLEGIEGTSTRGWDPGKVQKLEASIQEKYGVAPIWFGAKHVPMHNGQPLTLRQNIATLLHCDVAIGVLSGPLHFAAAVGLPTVTLYGDQPLHRAAPAYFLNEYVKDPKKRHRTILGPTNYTNMHFLKDISPNLTPKEQKNQAYIDWMRPGEQSTKSCVAAIQPNEVMRVLAQTLPPVA